MRSQRNGLARRHVNVCLASIRHSLCSAGWHSLLTAHLRAGLHMYSLNQDKSVVAILERLGLLDTQRVPRALPFRPRSTQRSEGVRPVYWANRGKAYVQRTQHWDRYPEHAWAEARCMTCP